MTSPARPLYLLFTIPAALTGVLFVYPQVWIGVAVIDGLLLCAALADLVTLPRKAWFRAMREHGPVATRGEKHRMALTVENRSDHSMDLIVRDDSPDGSTASEYDFPLQLPPRSRGRVQYQLTPRRRGTFPLEHVYLQTHSRYGLWNRNISLEVPGSLRVYPALKQISRYALYARLNKMSLLGVRRRRRVGTDNEFERLRDYTADDQFRAIDWRATSRRLKLTVKDFQSNQSQRVVFLLDCGRMMFNETDGESLLDAAFDAALTLGFVTLSQKDEAGLLCYSDRILRWLPPAAGRRQLNRMVHAVHDVFPELVESRIDLAFLHLAQYCRKRTLVIVITNVLDDRNAQQLKSHAAQVVGKHLPLAVLLRDHELFDSLESLATEVSGTASRGMAFGVGEQSGATPRIRRPHEDRTLDEQLDGIPAERLFPAAAAADVALWRQQVLTDLRHAGVLTLDTFPESLTAPLVNEYMRIKSLHLL